MRVAQTQAQAGKDLRLTWGLSNAAGRAPTMGVAPLQADLKKTVKHPPPRHPQAGMKFGRGTHRMAGPNHLSLTENARRGPNRGQSRGKNPRSSSQEKPFLPAALGVEKTPWADLTFKCPLQAQL